MPAKIYTFTFFSGQALNFTLRHYRENRPFIYQTGNQLMHLFNKYGYNDIEIAEFGSRGGYVRDKIRELNSTDILRQIVEDIVDPRRYINMNNSHNYEAAAKKINEIIGFDKYELKKVDGEYRVHDLKGLIVKPETTKGINHDFINVDDFTTCDH